MTNAAVPSKDPADFVLNIENLDKFSASTALTFTNRLGVVKPTLAGATAQIALDVAAVALAADQVTQNDIPGYLLAVQQDADLATGTTIPGHVSAVNTAKNAAINTSIPTAVALVNTAVAATAAGQATAAKIAAELARDSALATGKVYPTTAAGLTATASGQYFSVPSSDVAEYLILYLNDAGVAVEKKRYYSAKALESDPLPGDYELSWRDPLDNCALGILKTGEVEIPRLKATGGNLSDVSLVRASMGGMVVEEADVLGMMFAYTDQYGNIFAGTKSDGSPFAATEAVASTWKTLAIGDDDSIVHIGDSYTAAHYVLKDKAYISQLAALSPYRHANFGISGNDALDMNYRIVNGTAYADGRSFTDFKARYAFITTHENDVQFRTADLSYYRENLHRLVEVVRATGAEPIITTEFGMSLNSYLLLRSVADRYGLGFIDCNAGDAEVAGLDLGPFHQGHPGTRTGGVFWLPMLNFIDRMPRPQASVKVFRKRATFTGATIADLLYKGRVDRNTRWKELSLSHMRLSDATAQYYDELNGPNVYTHVQELDEYLRLENGQSVSFADYALIEVILPGTATTLDAVELTLTATNAPTVYVRNNLDTAAAPLGKAQGNTPANADYLAKWDKPRGAWRSLGAYAVAIVIPKADLAKSMVGDTLVVMVEKAGGFALTGLKVRYQGAGGKRDQREPAYLALRDPELLANQVCGTPGQLALWTTTGAPATLVPIDVSNAPRNAAGTAAVDGVCTITTTDTIGHTVTVTASPSAKRRYKLTVWARYFPKAFLDNATYGLASAQVVDRIAFPAGATITPETSDLRTVKCEVWTGAYPAAGGAEFNDFAALFWRPVEFLLEIPPLLGSTFSFRLSCTDGEVQVAKVSLREAL